MSTTTKRYLISFCFYFIASFVGVMLMQIENMLQTGNLSDAAIKSAIISAFTTTVGTVLKPLKDKINKYLLANPLDIGQ